MAGTRSSRENDFGRKLVEILRSRDVTQAQLARRLGARAQWVSQLVKGARTPASETVHRIASALGIPAESLDVFDASREGTPVRRMEERLDKICNELKASSCTLYLRDPLWRTEYRLAALARVQFKEPLFGFLSRRRDAALGIERFEPDTRPKKATASSRNRIPQALRTLFGDFCEREGVGAYARVVYPAHSDTPEAILFVNYKAPRTFSEGDKDKCLAQLKSLLPELPAVQRQLTDQDREWLADAARIVQPSSSITTNDVVGQGLDTYYRRILESALEALDVPLAAGLGTIHLYNADEQILTLAASCGCVGHTASASVLSVAAGDGVASWVARHRRALLMSDLESKFRPIHVPLNTSVQSELAVPLEVDGELFGVLSLQCTEPGRFKPHHVRSVWYAANRIGIVYRLYSQAEMNRELLEICSEATSPGLTPETALTHVARLAVKYLRAHSCRLWSYDGQKGVFTHSAWSDGRTVAGGAGNTPGPRRHVARRNGLSAHIVESQHPVWIANIRDESSFDAFHWLPAGWQERVPGQYTPKKINTSLQGEGIRCQLGLPIRFQNRCIGVAWVKFVRDHERPSHAQMTVAQGFMSAAGLILEAVRHR